MDFISEEKKATDNIFTRGSQLFLSELFLPKDLRIWTKFAKANPQKILY